MPLWVNYLINGMTVATFIAVMILLGKMMRWTGVMETEIANLKA